MHEYGLKVNHSLLKNSATFFLLLKRAKKFD